MDPPPHSMCKKEGYVIYHYYLPPVIELGEGGGGGGEGVSQNMTIADQGGVGSDKF